MQKCNFSCACSDNFCDYRCRRPKPCCCCHKGTTGAFLSSYMEALGAGQTVDADGYIVFDSSSIDTAGNNIVLNEEGTVFTINKTGLYHVEWTVNLADGSTPAVIGIVEGPEDSPAAASGAASSTHGNFSSGTLINVDKVPFTLALRNYQAPITIEEPMGWLNSAVSIRIARFADGPSV